MKKLTLTLVLLLAVMAGASYAETNDLHRAAKKGDLVAVTKLLTDTNMKMTVNAVDENGFTPLMYASIIGDVTISNMLIENGADVNAQNQSGATALMLAAKYDHLKLCKKLVKAGANAKLKTTNRQTAFTIASQYGNAEVAEFLANVTNRTFNKATYF